MNVYFGEKAEVEPQIVLEEDGMKGVVRGSELIMLIVAKKFEESHLIISPDRGGRLYCIV